MAKEEEDTQVVKCLAGIEAGCREPGQSGWKEVPEWRGVPSSAKSRQRSASIDSWSQRSDRDALQAKLPSPNCSLRQTQQRGGGASSAERECGGGPAPPSSGSGSEFRFSA